jgi:transcriptional regulator with PAS, ATPase and Fis domain
MAVLIGDRFLIRTSVRADESAGPDESVGLDLSRAVHLTALDLATGARVVLDVVAAGTRADQQSWTESCTRAHADGAILDFGFLGSAQRFEAREDAPAARQSLDAHETAAVVEWLEHARPSSPRILRLADFPDPRVLRQGGFVPCDLALLDDPIRSSDLSAVLARRSIVVLDRRHMPSSAALAVLRLRQLAVRELCVLTQRVPSKGIHVMHAAEGRAAYGQRTPGADPRMAQTIVEVERLLTRGRHAAAERALRAAMAAFERRSDYGRAGESALRLGRVLLGRGRASDARTLFTDAHDRFQRTRSTQRAIEAMVYLGLAQTDLAQLSDAEQTCRAAYTAASALENRDGVLFPAVALARTLIWQKRYPDARAILEAVEPVGDVEQCARYWCLAARLRIVAEAVSDAWRMVRRARPTAPALSPAVESLVRECEAAVQGGLGDIEALRIHVTNGLVAARTAHLPVQAVKLRLTYVEGLIRAERNAQARAAARHLPHIRRGAIPTLLKTRIDAALSALHSSPSVHESAARFHVTTVAPRTNDVQDLDGLRDLLASSHQLKDESEALTCAATAIRRHTHATGVSIFGWHTSTPTLFASCGVTGDTTARRSIDIGQSIHPVRVGSWIEGAVPIQYLGRIIGAIAVRWNIDGPENVERALAFSAAAAAVCAPLVYVRLERQDLPASQDGAFDLVGVSSAIHEVRTAITRAANAPFTVLLEGESGSGKELVARAIHRAGCRRERPFCAFNCAAMPEDLVDAELFGHAKGAFTGAAGERLGLFESAEGGTVFLDEVGELSARAQAKILRVLQEGEIRRIGENFTRPFDARLVAATNRALRAEADAGRFRQDLLYRLDVIRINVPPLRERIDDIPLLASRFWRQSAERIGSKAVLGQTAISALARYDWPGNVRELQNVLTALVVAVPPRGVVGASALPAAIARAAQLSSHESLESARLKFEERFVRAALARAAGHRGQAAAALGLSRQGLAKLMQRLHLDA